MSEVNVLMANVGHLDLSASRAEHARVLGRSLNWHRQFLAVTGCDGYEWHPLRDRMFFDIVALAGLGHFTTENQPPIVTAHQSFTAKDSSLAKRALWPPVRASLNAISAMQRRLGRQFDTVVYVEDLGPEETYLPMAGKFGTLGSQPSPDVWQKYGITSTAEEQTKLNELGVRYVPDLFHERRLPKAGGKRIEEMAGAYGPYTERYPQIAQSAPAEVHLSVGRVDFEKTDPTLAHQSLQELRALIKPNSNHWRATEAFDMLQLLETNLPPHAPSPTLVVEVPAVALRGLEVGFEQAYGRIMHNVKSSYPRRK